MWITVAVNLIQYSLVAFIFYKLWQASARLTQKRFLAIALAVAFLCRLFWVIYAPYEPTADYLWYHQRAIDLSQGLVYGVNGQPTAFWPVGYPFFLSLIYRVFGAKIIFGQLVNIFLGCLSVYITYTIAQRFFAERVARCAVIMMSLFIGQIYYTALLCSEILSQTLFLLALSLGLRAVSQKRQALWLLLTGFCTGLGVLTRPVVGIVVLSLLLIWMIQGVGLLKSLVNTAIVSLALCATIAPWTIRNYGVFHQFVPVSTNAGVSFWEGNNPYATGGYHFTDPSKRAEIVEIADEISRGREGFRQGFAFVRQQPLQWLRLLVKKPYYLYESDEQGLWFSFVKQGKEQPEVARWLYALWVKPAYACYGAVLLLACFGVFRVLGFGDRECRNSMSVVVIPTLLLTLFYIFFHTENRYNHTIMPLVVIASASGLFHFAHFLSSRKSAGEISAVEQVAK
jgi:4-amino-4-deoxy-L-arabinose transferase-like glycosyltransferase